MSDKIVIGYIHPGVVDDPWVHSLTGVLLKSECEIVTVISSSSARINRARNNVVAGFLELEADWLWMVDTDMTFDKDIVDRLLAAADPIERPIMGALAFVWNPEGTPQMYPSMFLREEPWGPDMYATTMRYPKDQVVQVAATGLGGLLIHRRALEAIHETYQHNPYIWFDETRLSADNMLGPDLTFCFRATEEGFPVHIDTSVKMGHIKPMIVEEATFEAMLGFPADQGLEMIEWKV